MGENVEITETIIGCVYTVANSLGHGFLEKVYENALVIELRKAGVGVAQQHPIPVLYDGELVGDFYADLLVEGKVIVELKAIKAFEDIHMAQTLNYLKATGLKTGVATKFWHTQCASETHQPVERNR